MVNYMKQEKVPPKSATQSFGTNGRACDSTKAPARLGTAPHLADATQVRQLKKQFQATAKTRLSSPVTRQAGRLGWFISLSWCCLICLCGVGLAQVRPQRQTQDLTVTNFLNPAAPLVRESLTQVEGVNFTDVTESNQSGTTAGLGGVQLMLDGVPQRLIAVSPTRLVFVLDAIGAATRILDIRTKADGPRRTQITLVNAWPSIIVQSMGTDENAFLPFGVYTTDGLPPPKIITNAPMPVGQQRLTLVTISGSGMRFASSIQVRLNGVQCQVDKVVPSNLSPGQDDLVFFLPRHLAQVGAVDLIVSVAGRESNYARLVLGDPVN